MNHNKTSATVIGSTSDNAIYLKCKTVLMAIYMLYIANLMKSRNYQKATCPKDTVLISARSIDKLKKMEQMDECTAASILQEATKSRLKLIESTPKEESGFIWNILTKIGLV